MARPKKSETASNDESSDFSFDPGTQIELELEDACCLTGEPTETNFCRFPDYKSGTLMVMSKSAMLKHLRDGDSIAKFKEVLVKRHGKAILEEYYSNY